MDNKQLAKKLIELSGTKSNIKVYENCMTRLRIELNDYDKADIEKLKKTEDVLGVVTGQNEIQIVLGPGKVARVAECFKNELGKIANATNKSEEANTKPKKKKSFDIQEMLKKISKIFIPLIPGIMAAGLLLGISELFTTLINNHYIESNAYVDLLILILSVLGTTCMSFLTIYVGINSAKVFKCTTILGAMIGALVIVDDLGHIVSQIQNIIDSIPYFDLKFYDPEVLQNSLLYTGKGGVIGVIIGVWILSKIEHALRKVVPETLDLIITPLVCVLVSGLLMLIVIMPISGIIADGIAKGLNYLNTSNLIIIKGLYGFLLGALYLPMVLLGLHQGLLPLYMVEISQNGFTTMICPQLMAGFAQIGAAICIYIKAKSIKHTSLTKTIAGSLPAALLGIGEPLIFGMSLPIAIVFLPIGLAAGCAGAFISLMECKALSYGPSALLGIVTMKPEYMITFAIGGLISVILGFLFTFLIVKKKRILKHKESMTDSNAGQDFNDLIHS